MLKNDACNASDGFLARPVTLPFAQHGHPGDWHRTGLNHAAHSHVMGFRRDAARGISDDEDIVSLTERLDCRHGKADLGIERGQNKLFAPALLHDVGNFRIFPSVDERAVDRLLLREDILKPLYYIAAAFFN